MFLITLAYSDWIQAFAFIPFCNCFFPATKIQNILVIQISLVIILFWGMFLYFCKIEKGGEWN